MGHKNNRSQYPSDGDPSWSHLSENAKGTPTYRELLTERQAKRAKARMDERFVRLGHDLTDSPAWRALGAYARDAYVWIERRYSGKNNGKIPMSVRELAELMGVDAKTARKAQVRLQVFGFLAVQEKGHIGVRGYEQRRATRWRLTQHRCGDNQATRDHIDVDVVEAEREYNLYFPRGTTSHHTYDYVPRTRMTTSHVPISGRSESQERAGVKYDDIPRRVSPTCDDVPQSIAGEARASQQPVEAEEHHHHARVLKAAGRSTTVK